MSFKEYLGHDLKRSLFPSAATGFGAGIGREGFVCGALLGAIMAIGMKFGRTDPKDVASEEKVNKKCITFWDLFEKEFGSNLCCDIIHSHLHNEADRQKWLVSCGMGKCADIVEKTSQLLCEFIEDR